MGEWLAAMLMALVLAGALGCVVARSRQAAQAALGLTTLSLGGVAMSLDAGWLALAWMFSGMLILLWALTSSVPSPVPSDGKIRSRFVTLLVFCLSMVLIALLLRASLPARVFGPVTSGAPIGDVPLRQAPGMIAMALALVVSLIAVGRRRHG